MIWKNVVLPYYDKASMYTQKKKLKNQPEKGE